MNSTVKNWSTLVRFQPAELLRPSSEDEVSSIVRRAAQEGKRIRVIGSGHSFTRLIETNDILISLDNLQGIISVDKDALTGVVWAGTKLKMLFELLHEHGLALPNQGDIDKQSVAGALSTGTHGTGVEFGTLSTNLISVTLVTATGEVLTCSATERPDLFKCAQISLGSMGIITRMEFRLVPAYKLKYVSKKAKLNEVLQKLDDFKHNTRNFEFYWFPYTETVQTKEMNQSDEKASKGGIGQWFSDIFMENGVFWALSKMSRYIPGMYKPVSKVSAWGISTGSSVAWSYNVFATPRLVRFNEMEFNIPQEHFEEAILEIKKTIADQKFRVHFPVECRWVKGDDIWMSPAYGRDSAYIAVHMYKGMKHAAYFDAMQAIFRKYGGRPHWGKMHSLSTNYLQAQYPKWADFMRIRSEMDPKGMFLNDYLKGLFGE